MNSEDLRLCRCRGDRCPSAATDRGVQQCLMLSFNIRLMVVQTAVRIAQKKQKAITCSGLA